ncbi:MAG: hypothetical protein JW809_06360 [Pirellulales bacterium]|nr:hypothetical protein [Pirellulales bacterium]
MQFPDRFIDTHCHLLPGLDDGAADWDESLAMARLAAADGIVTTIVTPHQLGAFAANDGPTIRARTAHLQDFLNQQDVPLRVLPGGEIRVEPDLVDRIRRGELMTLADQGRYVLVELPHELYLPLDGLLSEFRRAGLVGVLAHAERNQGILAQPARAEALVSAGCLLQVTATSLIGTFGPDVQRLAEDLIARGLAHLVATDAHSAQARRPLMGRAFERVVDWAGYRTAKVLFCDNPAAVVHDRPLAHLPGSRSGRRGVLARWFGGRKAG